MKTHEFKNETLGNKKFNAKNISIVFLSALVLIVGLIAFIQNKEKNELIENYQNERSIDEAYLKQTFQTIEQNLAEIRQREGFIQNNLNNPEMNGTKNPEERIQDEIQMIEKIMEKNKAIIAELNSKINGQNADLEKFKKTIDQTNKRLDAYKEEVAKLIAVNNGLQNDLSAAKNENQNITAELQKKLIEINSKSGIIDAQLKELYKYDSALNVVYYTVGDYKKLSDENLVVKDGGILGIGAAKILSDELDQSNFTHVDRRDLKQITIRGKRAELITPHESKSYEIIMKNDRVEAILIKDPETFWRDSRYLVVLVKDQDESLANLNN